MASRKTKRTAQDFERIAHERETRGLKAALRGAEAARKRMAVRLDEVEVELEAYAHALEPKTPPRPIKPRLSSGTSESTVIALASDWHVEEIVPPETVQGMNEYNPDIAERRARRYFEKLMSLVRMWRRDTKIDTLVLWCGGDFITGHIHEEMKETTAFAPLEAVDFAAKLLRAGFDFLLEHGEFKRIVVPCSFGNHGRLTRKPFTTKAAEHNLEWFMYRQLQEAFRSEKRLEFHVTRSRLHDSLEVYGRRIRFHHGEDLRYQGGLGGAYGRLFKAHQGWNANRKCYLTCVGHWHTYNAFQDLGLMNGSLIGYSAYAQLLHAAFEPPRQAACLIEKDMGMTFSGPVFVE